MFENFIVILQEHYESDEILFKEARIGHYILFATSVLSVPLCEERKHDVTVPENYGIRPTHDRHTSLF